MGPNIKKWLKVLGTNRRACVALDSENCTDFFDLERGTAQGDNISAFTFIIGYQIMLFKINYDLQIKSPLAPVVLDPALPTASIKVSREPPKIFAMADDATVITLMEKGSIERILNILQEFEQISGLSCNIDKTILMPIGDRSGLNDEIRALGIQVCKSVTLLGLEIENDTFRFNKTWDKIEHKLRNEINFWSRLCLTLGGRINVAKSLLYSQLNYIGCIIPIPNERIFTYSTLIEKFVVGKLNIATKKKYTLTRVMVDLDFLK
jgi:hypothetical protein